MAADSRVVDAVRARLAHAWPDLDNDPVYADQLAEEAADAAQKAIADILLAGGLPQGVPDRLRPTDAVLVRGGAIAGWLYVAATLDEIGTTVTEKLTELRRRYSSDLRAEEPYALLLKAEELLGKPVKRTPSRRDAVTGQQPAGNRRARSRPPVDLHDTEEL